ncbi:hypothetical protein [Micromonospora sp. CPCC 206061]|uniref:hypothetical protein n=1 Tax=Micromonospora sp. CPCC 206061 TaxID=3122410 RepID=UPI002FF08EEE
MRGERMPASLRGRGASVRSHEGALRGDGWRVYDLADNALGQSLDLVVDLSAASSSPVIAAYIADSDYGQLVAATPPGRQWGIWLNRRTAYEFERDHYVMNGVARVAARRRARQTIAGFGCPSAEAVRHAVQWAAEAGYSVPAGPIGQVLRTARRPGLAAWFRLPSTRYDFAEEIFFGLLDCLGIPRAITPHTG